MAAKKKTAKRKKKTVKRKKTAKKKKKTTKKKAVKKRKPAKKKKKAARKSSLPRCTHILSSGRKCRKFAVKNKKCDLHAERLSGALKAELTKYVRSRLPRRKRRKRRNPARKHKKLVHRCSGKTHKGRKCKNSCDHKKSKYCHVHRRSRRRRGRSKKR